MSTDKDFLPKLLNANDVEILESELNLKSLKSSIDKLIKLTLNNSKIEFPSKTIIAENVSHLNLINQPMFNLNTRFPNLTHLNISETNNQSCPLGLASGFKKIENVNIDKRCTSHSLQIIL